MDGAAGATPEAKTISNGACPLGWQLERYMRNEILLTMESAATVPQRAAFDLLQNCDLPPPIKLFPATPKGIGDVGVPPVFGLPSPNQFHLRKVSLPGTGADDVDAEVDPGTISQVHLLKALRLSQTRAREAEEKAGALVEKNKKMASLLMEESVRLYAHRQWLKLLQVENAWLRQINDGVQKKERQSPTGHTVCRRRRRRGSGVLTVCLVIVGLGLVVGCRFMC